ncbi:MAG: hypothetical protein MUC62_09260 [Candidatus Thermoplasmatota archaeon]|jgi:hypothetical protein|nr:hypothetical protein [Candidatus Thermoplasmatota archaeon]
MIARGELVKDPPGPKERSRRAHSRSLENNIRDLISEMDLTRVEERKQTLENLKRISSLKLHDPVLEEFELARSVEAKKKQERFDGLIKEMELEFERLISSLESTN